MEGSFIPECYFDTVLLKTILQVKGIVNHKMGCNNVMKAMEKGRLKDSFAVGIVDLDKTDLNYLNEFKKFAFEKLNLYRHRTKPQFVIQLNPPLEKWILKVAEEAEVRIQDFGLPVEIEKLKKFTKSELAEETNELKELCKRLVSSKSKTIKQLSDWLNYLKKNNYQSDINDLINV